MRSDAAGFALIEVLISAIILLTVAAGVFTAFDAGTRATALERHRAQANALAEQDLERVRSKRIVELTTLNETRNVTADGTVYTVVSRSKFLTETATTSTCASGTGSRDYLQLTSTVTWPGIGVHPPVTAATVVSPPSGSLVPDSGSLLVQVDDASSNGIPGVTLNGSGAGSFTGSTGSTGCVLWRNLPAGNYTMTASGAVSGMVDPDGNAPAPQTVSVVDQATDTVNLQYDRPGALTVSFKTEPYGNGTPIASNADGVLVWNSGMSVAKQFTTASPQATITTPSALYPFPSPSSYAVYAGSCADNNPDPSGNGSNAGAIGNVVVPAGGTGTLAPKYIELPALHLTVLDGGDSWWNQGSPVAGARVRITDVNCSVTRTYATNSAKQLADTPTGPTDPGLPYGTDYRICADAQIGSQHYMNYVRTSSWWGNPIEDVPVTNPTSGTVRTISLKGTGSTSGSGAVCP
ncbi:MAG: prepilin-type N-terminal cleavage/methylation domain-containing protein [Solirubrobacterales bacterium]